MNTENLRQTVELMAMALSEDGGYEYYHINDMLKELAKGVSDMHAENAKLTKLARWMYQVMDESCAVHYSYEPAPVSMQALMRAEKELQALGIEVDE